jgi:cellulose synthase/poly-beta-1,6-N-acetylglucosamine synthase-like glycosyltransferase
MTEVLTISAALFWCAVGLLVYTYVGYPLLLAAVAVFRRRERPSPGSYCPKLSVLIAARNEESSIARKLAETLALDYPADRLEIVVVSDGSTDRTDEIVEACADPRVRLIRVDAHLGKTFAQNVGVKQCSGDVIVFSDATARYDKSALKYLAAWYRDPAVGAVSGRYEYVDETRKSPTGAGSIVGWNYENAIKELQSRVGTLTGCSGCIYSVRRSAYEPLDPNLCSDLVEPLRVVRAGLRVVFEGRAVAHEETTRSNRQEFTMRVRVATRGMRGVASVPELLNFATHGWVAFQLLSHKILRWMVPIWLGVLVATSAALSSRPFYAMVFGAQVAFYVFVAVSSKRSFCGRWRVLGIPMFFVTINAAMLVALWEVIRGHRYVVWETERH